MAPPGQRAMGDNSSRWRSGLFHNAVGEAGALTSEPRLYLLISRSGMGT